MTIRSEIPVIIVIIALGGCFKADDADDEIGATETTGTTDSTDTTSESSTESTSESTTDSTSDSDTTTGADPFVFASDPPENYARVDRMGMPAVATVLITSKDEYNAEVSIEDPTSQFFMETNNAVIALHASFNDDLIAAGLTPCNNAECLFEQTLVLSYPDTLKLDLTTPPAFPNGRRISDRVIDLTLAVILLDLDVHPVTTLAELPLNPPANDVVFLPAFPFLAPPH